jgi:hypothetical protein
MGKGLKLAKIMAVGLALLGATVVPARAQLIARSMPDADIEPYNVLRAPPTQEVVDQSRLSLMPLAEHRLDVSERNAGKQTASLDDDDWYIPLRDRWYVRAEGGAMLRPMGSPYAVYQALDPLQIGSGLVVPVLTSSNIPDDFAMAANFMIGRTLNDCIQLEGQFTGSLPAAISGGLWDDHFNQFQTPEGTSVIGNMFSPFSNFGGGLQNGIAGLDYNKFASIRASTAFHSAELNVRRRIPLPPELMAMSVLVGVRYAGMPEEFSYYTVSDIDSTGQYYRNGAINEIRVSTTNELVGPQVGALVQFYTENRWWFDFEMKVGLMNNSCSETSYYRNVNDGNTSVFQSSQSSNHMSVLTDLNVTGIYRWSPHFTARLGYRAVWMTNVALAQSNFSTDINVYRDETSLLSAKSGTLFHGPFIGFDFGW